jgi:hypothetical protein
MTYLNKNKIIALLILISTISSCKIKNYTPHTMPYGVSKVKKRDIKDSRTM